MNALVWTQLVLVMFGGILAISGLIVSKQPNAKQVIDKLVPFQAVIGVGMLIISLILIGKMGPMNLMKHAGDNLATIAVFGLVAVGIVLGFLFGMPQIAKWLPGQSVAEQKAMEAAQKLAGFQVMIGLVGLAVAAVLLLIKLKIIAASGGMF